MNVCAGSRSCSFVLSAGGFAANSVNIGGLAAGTSHNYGVTEVVNGIESARTTLVVTTLIPASPTNLLVTAMPQNSVTLNWTAPATSQVPVIG